MEYLCHYVYWHNTRSHRYSSVAVITQDHRDLLVVEDQHVLMEGDHRDLIVVADLHVLIMVGYPRVLIMV